MEEISRNEITLLWHTNYYDGPLSGMCGARGERLWFDVKEEYPETDDEGTIWHRTFVLYRLLPEQLEVEEKWHKLFQEHVGLNCDYQNGKRQAGATWPQENWDKYYEPAKEKPKLDLTLATPVFTVKW